MTKPITPDLDLSAKTDPLPVGSQAQYEKFLPTAAAISEDDLRPLRTDVSLAIVNARTGVDAVLEHVDEIRASLPNVSIPAIRDVLALGLALAFADGQLERYAPPVSDTRALMSRSSYLRNLLLGAADTLVLANVLPGPVVKKIREGRGSIDTAGDCVALAALYQEHEAAVRGKVPFTGAEVAEAAEVGSRLLAVLRPEAAARKPIAREVAAATLVRNQLWSLFERTWEDHVWRSGAWLFRREVDEHVPPLGSRVVSKRPAETPPDMV